MYMEEAHTIEDSLLALRLYREQAGHSQTKVASDLGLSGSSQVSLWEKGGAEPSTDNIFGLSIIYNVPTDILFAHIRQRMKAKIEERRAIPVLASSSTGITLPTLAP